MKARFFSSLAGWLAAAAVLEMACVSRADNSIYGFSSPGFTYVVTNIPANSVYANALPDLDLTAGATYKFIIGVDSIHPVVIATNNSGSFGNPPVEFAYDGASPQAVSADTITITIPETDYPPTLYYQCNFHFFYGQINVLPPPPPNQLLSLSVTTNIVLISTGVTNTWTLVPEFSSNLLSKVWSPVGSYSNAFNGASNITTFNRLDPICGPNVFLRVRVSPPVP